MVRRCFAAAATVAALIVSASLAFAQVDRATLTGTVQDPQGAVVRDAQIKVTNLGTNSVATARTNDQGTYLVVNLPPGEYLVQVEAQGFQRFEQTVSLQTGARSRLDLSLAIGSIGETVTVEGVTPLVNTENAVLGTVVDSNEVAKLPLAIDFLLGRPGLRQALEDGTSVIDMAASWQPELESFRRARREFLLYGE